MAEKQVPKLLEPLEFMVSERKGCLCKIRHDPPGHLRTFFIFFDDDGIHCDNSDFSSVSPSVSVTVTDSDK